METRRHAQTLVAAFLVLQLVSGCDVGLGPDARLARGQAAFDQADYRAAAIDAKRVLQKDPDNPEARLLLGRASLQLGDPVTAEKELTRAAELGVDAGTLIVDFGHTLLRLGKFERVDFEIRVELALDDQARLDILRIRGDALLARSRAADARELYRTVLAERREDVDTKLALVNSHISEKDLETARNVLDEIIDSRRDYVRAWIVSGALSILQGNAGRAQVDLTTAYELAVESADVKSQREALHALIEVQLAEHDVDAVQANLQLFRGVEPAAIVVDYLSAQLSYLQGDWQGTLQHLLPIVRQSPSFGPAQLLLGAVQMHRHNFGQAEAYIAAAVELMPKNLEARQLLAEIRMQRGGDLKIGESPEAGIAVDIGESTALAIAARASLNAGEIEQAVRYLEDRVASDPGNISHLMDLSATFLAIGEVEDAEAVLSSIEGNASYKPMLLRVVTAYRKGQLEQALELADEMRVRWPDDTLLLNVVGAIHLASNDTAAARQSFQQALDEDPSNVNTLVSLSRLDERDNDFNRAKLRYLAALGLLPGEPTIMLSLARLAVFSGDYAEAHGWLNRVIESDPDNFVALSILAKVHLALGNFGDAADVARRAIELDDSLASSHNSLGLALVGQGDMQAAVNSLARAVSLEGSNPTYSVNLARAQLSAGFEADAERTLLNSLQSNPEDLSTAVMLASYYARKNSPEEALHAARSLEVLFPKSVGATIVLAELLYRYDDVVDASRTYEKALRASNNRQIALRAYRVRAQASESGSESSLIEYLDRVPDDLTVRVTLAQDYQRRGDNISAARQYERVINQEANNVVSLNNLAWIYLVSGDQRAERLARRAAQLAPDNGSVLDTLGWILVTNGETGEGIDYLREAANRDGRNANVQYHLAAALAQTDEKGEAREILIELLAAESQFLSRGEAEYLLRQMQ